MLRRVLCSKFFALPWRPALALAVTFCTSLIATSGQAEGLQWRRGAAEPTVTPAAESRVVLTSGAKFVSPSVPAAQPAAAETAQPVVKTARAKAKRPTTVVEAKEASPAKVQTAWIQPSEQPVELEPEVRQALIQLRQGPDAAVQPAGYTHPCGEGCPEPGCCLPEPGCACPGPTCSCTPPACPTPCPGCGFAEPDCACLPEVCGECVCGDVGCCGECMGPESCNCGSVGCFGGCHDRGAIPIVIFLPPIKEVALFAGVHGFKTPFEYDLDVAGDVANFGIHEGFQIGGRMSWLPLPGLGYQVGYQAVHSQFSGNFFDLDSGDPAGDSHTQQFVTAGLFHRECIGWQYGFVWDMLRDERVRSVDYHQVRGLLGYTYPRGGEVGFQFAVHTNEEAFPSGATYRASDQYLLYYRHHGRSGGELRCFGGVDDDSRGILGGDLYAPLNEAWSIQTGFTYFIPSDGGTDGHNATEESWNLGINLVWHWGGSGKRWYRSPWRPMFNVADNGSLSIDDVD